jgi:hypothetical protein
MSPSSTDLDQRDEPPNKKPQIGRREIVALLLLLAINWAFVLLFYSAAVRQRVALPYSPTFLTPVQDGNVATLTAQDAAIQGTFKHAIRYPARDKNARPTPEFSTRVPDFADTKAALFAHVGGFVFGAVVTRALLNAGRVVPQSTPRQRPALAAL